MEDANRPGTIRFLKDALLCSLGAYGGPEAHAGVFLNILVEKRRYLSEAELIELIALCGFLPGPSSTQTITAVGYKLGGPKLAFLTLLVWALPALTVMAALSFLYGLLAAGNVSADFLRYLSPMALGFIAAAAWKIGRKVIGGPFEASVALAATVATVLVRQAWIFPAALLAGGLAAAIAKRESKKSLNPVKLHPHWGYLAAFAAIACGALLAAALSDNRLLRIFESFYRYGYLVIGGGQVVVPLMQSELVEFRSYMTNEEFLTGYGLVQGLPGPMFSFAAYAGGLASRGEGALYQAAGAAAAGLAIFLPGTLLIFFAYPAWEELKGIRAVRNALGGISAAAVGLIVAAALKLSLAVGFRPDAIAVAIGTTAALLFTKIPATVLVVLCLAAGAVIVPGIGYLGGQ